MRTLVWTLGGALLGASLLITGCSGKGGEDTGTDATGGGTTDGGTDGGGTTDGGTDGGGTDGGGTDGGGTDGGTTGTTDGGTTDGGTTGTTDGGTTDGGTTGTTDGGTTDGDSVIYQIQTGAIATGSFTTIEGVVAGDSTGSGFYVLDGSGGPYSGIWVYYGGAEPGEGLYEPVEGDWVQVSGTVAEYAGDGSANTVTELEVAADSDVVYVTSGVALPAAVPVTVDELADPATAEPYESVLIVLSELEVTDPDAGYGDFIVNDSLYVDDQLYATLDDFSLLAGDTFESITGLLNESYSAYRLAPRYEADLAGYVAYEPPCLADLCAGDLAAGELVISELMPNPAAVDDSKGEWFEVYNATAGSVDLQGLSFYDDGSNSFTVADSTIVAAGDYAVLGSDGDSGVNGGVSLDYEYGGSMALSNGDDELYIAYDGLVIDAVLYDTSKGWSVSSGASMSLDPMKLDAASNDLAASWCEASSSYGSGDLGTPGAANDACAGMP